MTQSNFSQERKLLSIKNGVAKVWQGSTELESKTWVLGAKLGGTGGSTYETKNLIAEMVRKERKTITDFLRMKEKMYAEVIPILKEERRQNMIDRFGTTDTTQLLENLYQGMLANPRIQRKTRKGQTIKTTLAEQKAYAQERSALAVERKRV